jgi:predicted XRE-type DNA-binding protein
MDEQAGSTSPTELEAEVLRLRSEMARMQLWCRGLEEQQAQLAAVLGLVAPSIAQLGLTRFAMGTTLPDQLPVHREE